MLLDAVWFPPSSVLHGAIGVLLQEAALPRPIDTSVGEIVGHRLRIDCAGLEALTPTVRVTAQDLSVGARPNTAAALNDLPQFRATTSAQTTGEANTGAGNAPVDLRGPGHQPHPGAAGWSPLLGRQRPESRSPASSPRASTWSPAAPRPPGAREPWPAWSTSRSTATSPA
ncbi:hypothetical protein ACRAWD_30870 [Caulobacter segnis]